jgi:hypothetical protein
VIAFVHHCELRLGRGIRSYHHKDTKNTKKEEPPFYSREFAACRPP